MIARGSDLSPIAQSSRGGGLAFDVAFRNGAVAAGSFRLIERAIAPLDHHFRGLGQAELRNAD